MLRRQRPEILSRTGLTFKMRPANLKLSWRGRSRRRARDGLSRGSDAVRRRIDESATQVTGKGLDIRNLRSGME
jgi:hypothetical protein